MTTATIAAATVSRPIPCDGDLAALGLHSRGLREIIDFAQGRPEALGALTAVMTALQLALAPHTPAPARRRRPVVSDIPDTIPFGVRLHRRDELCRDLHRASGDERWALHAEILRQHTPAERIEIRRRLLKVYRERYAGGLSANAASTMISKGLDRRASTNARSTGNVEMDQFLDKIWCCGSKLSERTIRSELA